MLRWTRWHTLAVGLGFIFTAVPAPVLVLLVAALWPPYETAPPSSPEHS